MLTAVSLQKKGLICRDDGFRDVNTPTVVGSRQLIWDGSQVSRSVWYEQVAAHKQMNFTSIILIEQKQVIRWHFCKAQNQQI